MSDKPFFSVVMPTRNRASYLPTSIGSVLQQTFRDFEIIVSDNFSDDNTFEVVQSFADSRIKYVKTDSFLPINQSWAFGIDYTEGEYVTFLSDDDAYSKIFLESFEKEIHERNPDVVACRMAQYYENPHYETRHKFTCPNFTNRNYVYNLKGKESEFLQYMFARGELTGFPAGFDLLEIPYLANAAYRRTVFSEVKNKLNSIFPRNLNSTDVYSTATILSQFVNKYSYLDKPLYVQRISDISLTRTTDIEKAKKTYGKPSHDLGKYQDFFLNFSHLNPWIEACLLAVIDTKVSLDFELFWTKYYIKAFDSLKYMQSHGFDMSAEQKSFFDILSRQDKEMQREVLSVITTPRMRVNNFIRRSKMVNSLLKVRDNFRRKQEDLVGLDEPLEINQYAEMIDGNFLHRFSEKLAAT